MCLWGKGSVLDLGQTHGDGFVASSHDPTARLAQDVFGHLHTITSFTGIGVHREPVIADAIDFGAEVLDAHLGGLARGQRGARLQCFEHAESFGFGIDQFHYITFLSSSLDLQRVTSIYSQDREIKRIGEISISCQPSSCPKRYKYIGGSIMKKVIVATLVAGLSLPVLAGGSHHTGHHHHHHGSNWNWLAPAIISGAVVYAATRPTYVYPSPPPVIVSNAPPAPYGYRYEIILDASCNCYRQVLVQN